MEDEETPKLELYMSISGGDNDTMMRAKEKLDIMAAGFGLEGLRVTVTIDTDEDYC